MSDDPDDSDVLEPEYETPEGVGPDPIDPEGADPEPDPDPAKAAAGAEPATDPTGRMIPAYRLAEVQGRFQRDLEASTKRVELLEGMIRNVLGGKDPEGRASGAPSLSPDQQRLRGEFLKLFPEFEQLVQLGPKAQDLLGLAARAPDWDRENEQYWGRVAQQTSAKLFETAAAGLGLKTLDPDDQAVVRTAFISWVKSDQTNARNHRYEGQDSTLVPEFWKFFTGRFQQPGARAANAATLRQSAGARPLPRGGNSSSRVPPSPAGRVKPKTGDEDPFESVNSRAWAQLQDEATART